MVEDFVLGAISGGGLVIVVRWLAPRALRAFGYHLPRNMDDYRIDLERKAIAVIQSSADTAMHEAALMETIGSMPKQFDPAAMLGLNVAQAVQREVVLEHERRGLVPAGMHDRIFGRPAPQDAPGEPQEAEPEPVLLSNVRRLHGRLVPRKPAAGS